MTVDAFWLNKRPLTAREAEVFAAVAWTFAGRKDWARSTAKALGISIVRVYQHVQRIERKGWAIREGWVGR